MNNYKKLQDRFPEESKLAIEGFEKALNFFDAPFSIIKACQSIIWDIVSVKSTNMQAGISDDDIQHVVPFLVNISTYVGIEREQVRKGKKGPAGNELSGCLQIASYWDQKDIQRAISILLRFSGTYIVEGGHYTSFTDMANDIAKTENIIKIISMISILKFSNGEA